MRKRLGRKIKSNKHNLASLFDAGYRGHKVRLSILAYVKRSYQKLNVCIESVAHIKINYGQW